MRKILFILLFFQSLPGIGQIKEIGSPSITNYRKSIYKAGTQNWGISQDEKGFIYFANNEGVLIFNGLQWELVEVSTAKPIRSVYTDSKNKVYIGLLNDFGYLQQNSKGLMSFISLRNLLPDSIKDFDDIWRIHEIPQGIVFQTYEYLFVLSDDGLSVITPNKRFHFSFVINGRLFLHEPGLGLFEYINNSIIGAEWSFELKDFEISAILEAGDDRLLICTNGNGIYEYKSGRIERWNSPVNKIAERDKLYSARKITGNHLAFGTILNGLVITDQEGNIIQHINKLNGLQNNTVLSIFSDRDDNLWLGLDNGADYIEINSPVSYFSDFEGIGTGYCARVFRDKLYLGTNQGLFVKSFNTSAYSDEKFELVRNTAGQVWSLTISDGQLLCGHNMGTFVVEDRVATKISTENGAWKYISISNNSEILLGGHYNGLVLLRKGKSGWEYFKKVEGFNESCRFIHQGADNTIWVSHGAKGIFQVILNETLDSVASYELYNSEDGLPSDEQNIVFSLNKEVFFSTIQGMYIFDQDSGLFKRSAKWNAIFSVDGRLKTFEADDAGNLWYIAQNESGVLRHNEDGTYTNITSQLKRLDGKYVNEFEFIYPYRNNYVFIGIDNGFAHYSSRFPKVYSKNYSSFITKVEIPYLDSVLYLNQVSNLAGEFVFPFRRNAFRFFYTAPFFEDIEQLSFSFFLENFSEKWSDYSSIYFKDFTNLQEGDYIFRVKAKNVYGVESGVSSFSFTVKPPWHRSTASYIAYLVFLLLVAYLTRVLIRQRIKMSKKRQSLRHQLEIKRREEEYQHQAIINEKEILRLKNEKMAIEMEFRGKELANQTMVVIQKNKLLSKLKEEIDHIQKTTENPQLRTKMIVLSNRLDKEIDNKQQNKIFQTYFEEVHNDFFLRLKKEHSNLSPRETHLSAFIRMNLSSKEIATLLNITFRGVEISRYRLRKKLGLSREESLSTYLLNI